MPQTLWMPFSVQRTRCVGWLMLKLDIKQSFVLSHLIDRPQREYVVIFSLT